MASLFGNRPVMEMDAVVGQSGTMADDALTLSSPLLTEVDVEASGLDIDLALDGSAGTDISVTATAEATGIDGLEGADAISTHALLEVFSETQATSESVTLNLADFENANASVSAISNSQGVQGGEGADTILNHNTVRVGANSFSANPLVGDNLDVTVFDVAGGTVTSSAFSHATAVALDGGADDDLIRNFGTTEATAQANALRYVSSIGIIGNPSSESMVDAQALATAIFGGQGKDHIENHGSVTVMTRSDVMLTEDSLALESLDLDLAALPSIDAPVTSLAAGKGIDGGDDDDTILNATDGTIMVTSDPFLRANTSIVNALSIENFLATPDIESSAASLAEALGIDGGAGNDTILNQGSIVTLATPEARANEIDVSILGAVSAVKGVRSIATATGIEGGLGDDTLRNLGGTIDATADAKGVATTVSVAIGVVPAPTNLVFPFVESEAVSGAYATGMSGGSGNDTIENTGSISADADAVMNSVGVAAKVGFSGGGGGGGGGGGAAALALADDASPDEALPLQSATANAATERRAEAVGIAGGSGDDFITNTGSIESTADAVATGVEVNASLGIAIGAGDQPIGQSEEPTAAATPVAADTVGGAEQRAITDLAVISVAEGIQGGTGDDTILNGFLDDEGPDDNSPLMVTATARATDVGVKANISIPASPLGLFTAGIGVDAAGQTLATGTGLMGGAGDDMIVNYQELMINAFSEVNSVAVEANSQITIPLVLPEIFTSNVISTTDASAAGILGDGYVSASGDGDDTIINHGDMTIRADADATGVSVTASLAGAAIADIPTQTFADARGIDSGGGSDTIVNDAELMVTADAKSASVGVEVVGAGAAIGSASTSAVADARGIIGGGTAADGNLIHHQGMLTVEALADANSTLVDVLLSPGASLAFAETAADAEGIGIGGGAGNDSILAEGPVSVTADADAQATSVVVGLLSPIGAGAAIADNTGTRASSEATGLHGGGGDDRIDWRESVTATSRADAGAVVVAVVGPGAAIGFTGTDSESIATAVNGGSGNDLLLGSGPVNSTSTATTGSVSVEASLAGASVANADTVLNATSHGVAAGEGDDTVMNPGPVRAEASATSGAVDVLVNAAGASVGHAKAISTAEATGIDGGDGDDRLLLDKNVEAIATANHGSTGVAVTLVGAGVQNSGAVLDATAQAVTGGAGRDEILSTGTLTADASHRPVARGERQRRWRLAHRCQHGGHRDHRRHAWRCGR